VTEICFFLAVRITTEKLTYVTFQVNVWREKEKAEEDYIQIGRIKLRECDYSLSTSTSAPEHKKEPKHY